MVSAFRRTSLVRLKPDATRSAISSQALTRYESRDRGMGGRLPVDAAAVRARYLLIGIMMCAPGVPGAINHGTP